MGILEGKKILVTGVLTDASIAFHVARVAQEEGATVVLTAFPRPSLTERIAKKLPVTPPVLELDVTSPEHMGSLADRIRGHVDGLDGVVHSIGFAPQDALGGNFLNTPWESVSTAFQTSAYSLKALAAGMAPLMEDGGSIVSLDFDGRFAWPIYDWMGVAKAGLESVTRYLARDLGPRAIRVNTVSAGPIKTIAGKGIPGFEQISGSWDRRAPLGWDVEDPTPVGNAVAFLLSDLSGGITGELIHVDGGFHAMGTELG